jgi:hypothetical protein
LKEKYLRDRDQYELENPSAAKKRRRVPSQPNSAAKALPSPASSPDVDQHSPPPAPKQAEQSSPKEQGSKKDRSPKSERKHKERHKEKEKDKDKKRRKSEAKS